MPQARQCGLIVGLMLVTGGCAPIFGTPDPAGIAVHNDTDIKLQIQYSDGDPRLTFGPGSSGEIAIQRQCETLALVALRDGVEYASVADERLCDPGTRVFVRGENDMVIEDR